MVKKIFTVLLGQQMLKITDMLIVRFDFKPISKLNERLHLQPPSTASSVTSPNQIQQTIHVPPSVIKITHWS